MISTRTINYLSALHFPFSLEREIFIPYVQDGTVGSKVLLGDVH
jgi:hypothetical protein